MRLGPWSGNSPQINFDGRMTDILEVSQHSFLPRSAVLWMVSFYMLLFIVRPWEQMFPSIAAFHPERVYAICMIIAVFLSNTKTLRLTWQTFTVSMFYSAFVISGLCSYNRSLATEAMGNYLSIIIFYFIILVVIRTLHDLMFIIISYIGIMGLYLAKSQWEYFVHGRHHYRMAVSRLIGIENTFGGPNALAMSIVVSLPFAYLLWKHRIFITRGLSPLWQTVCRRGIEIFSILAITSIVLTNSRSGMLGFVVFIILFILSGKGFLKKVGYLLVGVLALSIIWTVMPAENKGRIETIWAPEKGPANAQTSAEGRIEGFMAGIEMFRRHPYTGVGVGNFVAYRVQNLDGISLEAHNLVGQVLGEMGALGAVTFVLMIGATISNCRKTWNNAINQSDDTVIFLSDLARACFLSLTLLTFLGMFGHNLYRFNWLWLAAFAGQGLQFMQERLFELAKEAQPAQEVKQQTIWGM